MEKYLNMLLRASISEIKSGRIKKQDGHLVVTMRMYPRFLSKLLIDEYQKNLSPQKELFENYREYKKKIGDQSKAFELAQYQTRFVLTSEGLLALQNLVEISKNKNVYMICQCEKNERCHVDLMLLIAQNKFAAKIEKLHFEYSVFKEGLG